MNAEHDLEQLEELALGALSAADAATVERHLAECTDCRAELALLRAERGAFEARAVHIDDAEMPPFEGVLARMPEHQVARAVPTTVARPPRRLPTPWIVAGAAAIPLAAGVLLGLLAPHEPAPVITAVASAAAATPSPVAIPRRHHSALSCEPDADDPEPSCGSCSGDDDAGAP